MTAHPGRLVAAALAVALGAAACGDGPASPDAAAPATQEEPMDPADALAAETRDLRGFVEAALALVPDDLEVEVITDDEAALCPQIDQIDPPPAWEARIGRLVHDVPEDLVADLPARLAEAWEVELLEGDVDEQRAFVFAARGAVRVSATIRFDLRTLGVLGSTGCHALPDPPADAGT